MGRAGYEHGAAPMNRLTIPIIGAGALGLAIGLGAIELTHRLRPFSFNECMLEQMRGQPPASLAYAYPLCTDRQSAQTGPWARFAPKDDWQPVPPK